MQVVMAETTTLTGEDAKKSMDKDTFTSAEYPIIIAFKKRELESHEEAEGFESSMECSVNINGVDRGWALEILANTVCGLIEKEQEAQSNGSFLDFLQACHAAGMPFEVAREFIRKHYGADS